MTSTYISLTKSGVRKPSAFGVLLCPLPADAKAPLLRTLDARRDTHLVSDAEAIGVGVVQSNNDDLLVMAKSSALRQYGTSTEGLLTDGEAAFVRRSGGKVLEFGLVRGAILEHAGKRLIQAGPDVVAVHVQSDAAHVRISTEGRGTVSILSSASGKFFLNGKPVNVAVTESRVVLKVGSDAELTLSKPAFSTTGEALGRAIGITRPMPQKAKFFVVTTWKTSAPSTAVLEYRKEGATEWLRSVNPVLTKDHRFLLGTEQPYFLEDGKSYRLRITCRSADGGLGKAKATYTHRVASSKTSRNHTDVTSLNINRQPAAGQ